MFLRKPGTEEYWYRTPFTGNRRFRNHRLYSSGSQHDLVNMIDFPDSFPSASFFLTFGFIPCSFSLASQCIASHAHLNIFLQKYEVLQSASCNNTSN